MIDDIDEITRTEWTNEYKVRLFWDLVAEVKRLRKALNAIAKQPEGRAIMDCYPCSPQGIVLREMIE